jgi:3-oxoacyl-[acyl-carrier-protein] synthase-1
MAFNVIGAGMVTAVGFDAPASCAALRARLDGFEVTRFMFDGDWLQGAEVPLAQGSRGEAKLVEMASMTLRETLAQLPAGRAGDTALLLCLAESTRPGRAQALEHSLDWSLRQAHDADRLTPQSKVFSEGTLGAIKALQLAESLLAQGQVNYAIVLGVDSYLQAQTLLSYHEQRRLLTSKNTDGFIPGEAAGALLITRPSATPGAFRCLGMGFGTEPALIDSDLPLRADGLTQAYKAALAVAGFGFEQLDYRMTDVCGEQYGFKEASLALSRCMRVRKETFELQHTADSIGRVGAASVPIAVAAAWMAARKDYAPGPGVLCHFADDAGGRAALVLREHGKSSNPVL